MCYFFACHVGRTATLWVRHYWSIKLQPLFPLQHSSFGVNASGLLSVGGWHKKRPLERRLILLTMTRPSKSRHPHSGTEVIPSSVHRQRKLESEERAPKVHSSTQQSVRCSDNLTGRTLEFQYPCFPASRMWNSLQTAWQRDCGELTCVAVYWVNS